MGDVEATAAGQDFRGYRRGTVAGDPVDQYVVPVSDRVVSFIGRAATFITPGRAAVGQKILSLHNATGSTVLCGVDQISVDVLITAVKAVTIVPPVIRVHRFTTAPTNGTVLTKTGLDSSLTSNASVEARGDASADGTLSATTLTVTPAGLVAQKYGPRVFTAVGYEPIDTAFFFAGEPEIILRAGEGVVVFLDQAVITNGNPATDRWFSTVHWSEFTRP